MSLLGWILGWAAAHPVHPLDPPLFTDLHKDILLSGTLTCLVIGRFILLWFSQLLEFPKQVEWQQIQQKPRNPLFPY